MVEMIFFEYLKVPFVLRIFLNILKVFKELNLRVHENIVDIQNTSESYVVHDQFLERRLLC
jgi:hypothetical protein